MGPRRRGGLWGGRSRLRLGAQQRNPTRALGGLLKQKAHQAGQKRHRRRHVPVHNEPLCTVFADAQLVKEEECVVAVLHEEGGLVVKREGGLATSGKSREGAHQGPPWRAGWRCRGLSMVLRVAPAQDGEAGPRGGPLRLCQA
jgi:hypothetical protein